MVAVGGGGLLPRGAVGYPSVGARLPVVHDGSDALFFFCIVETAVETSLWPLRGHGRCFRVAAPSSSSQAATVAGASHLASVLVWPVLTARISFSASSFPCSIFFPLIPVSSCCVAHWWRIVQRVCLLQRPLLPILVVLTRTRPLTDALYLVSVPTEPYDFIRKTFNPPDEGAK